MAEGEGTAPAPVVDEMEKETMEDIKLEYCCNCQLANGITLWITFLILYSISNIYSVFNQWLDPRLRVELAFLALFSIVAISLAFMITITKCTCLISLCKIYQCVKNNCNSSNNDDISYADIRKYVSKIFYYFMIFHLIYHIFFVIETIVAYVRCTASYNPDNNWIYEENLTGFCRLWAFFSYFFSAIGLILDFWGIYMSRKLFRHLRSQ